jgi:GrpB-like predicted nucleotidyltransferase (UPF0157 family)
LPDPIEIVPYDPAWPDLFITTVRPIRAGLKDLALRIDHIGSTSIPGLAAKPIIDIQLSVASFEPFDPIRLPMENLGYVFRADNEDRSKRYFRETPGTRRTHIHIRRAGSWPEQFALLFRDYMCQHADAAAAYAALKYALAEKYRHDRAAYVEAKMPFIWQIMMKADRWSQATGWAPGPSDF